MTSKALKATLRHILSNSYKHKKSFNGTFKLPLGVGGQRKYNKIKNISLIISNYLKQLFL